MNKQANANDAQTPPRLIHKGQEYYSVAGAMVELDRSRTPVMGYIKSGVLKAYKFGVSKEWYITIESVELLKNRVIEN